MASSIAERRVPSGWGSSGRLMAWRARWRALLRRLTYHSSATATPGTRISDDNTPLLVTRTSSHDLERTLPLIRKESKADSFQRQISALRQQLGGQDDDPPPFDDAEAMPADDLMSAQPRANVPALAYAPDSGAAQMGDDDWHWPVADAETGVLAAGSHWDGHLQTRGSLHIYWQRRR